MARKIDIDDNEKAGLLALQDADPERGSWINAWALTTQMASHGAEPLACTFDGSVSVFRRLAQRKLVDGDEARGKWRGFSMNDKGVQALADNVDGWDAG
jgi:hypothetical protein